MLLEWLNDELNIEHASFPQCNIWIPSEVLDRIYTEFVRQSAKFDVQISVEDNPRFFSLTQYMNRLHIRFMCMCCKGDLYIPFGDTVVRQVQSVTPGSILVRFAPMPDEALEEYDQDCIELAC